MNGRRSTLLMCVFRYNDVSRYCWSYAKGDHFVGAINNEDQDHCSTWTQILRVDRWFDSGFVVDLSTDVDLETRIWRIGSIHRSPQMFLSQCSLQSSSTELLSTLLSSVSFFVYSSSLRLSVHVWKLLRSSSSSSIWLCARVYLLVCSALFFIISFSL